MKKYTMTVSAAPYAPGMEDDFLKIDVNKTLPTLWADKPVCIDERPALSLNDFFPAHTGSRMVHIPYIDTPEGRKTI